jgi:two-component SAPR family response regulator
LSTLRLILVEDESLVAIMMEDMLVDLGCEVVGSFGHLDAALSWLEDTARHFDGAILDVNLGGEMVFPLAQALRDRGVPFVFATGYGEISDQRFAAAPLIHKPVNPEALSLALESLRTAA